MHISLVRTLNIGPRLAAAFAALAIGLLIIAAVGADEMASLKSDCP